MKSVQVVPRVSLNPFFNAVNNYFKALVSGEPLKFDRNVQEGLNFWYEEDCGLDCNECLFSKQQEWIKELNLVEGNDLCSLLDRVFDGNVEHFKNVDAEDLSYIILPENISK